MALGPMKADFLPQAKNVQGNKSQYYLNESCRQRHMYVGSSTSKPPELRKTVSAPARIMTYHTPAELRKLRREPESPKSPVPDTPFPFEALPAEIRNKIYRELLLLGIPMMLIHNCPSWPDVENPGHTLHPAILLANRKTHDEAAAVLYGENTFYIFVDEPLQQFQDRFWLNARAPEMILRAEITLYMSYIKRVLVFSSLCNMILQMDELKVKYWTIGLKWDDLVFWAIKFNDGFTLELNAIENRAELKIADARDLKKKITWFSEGLIWAEGSWLVKKL